MQVKYIFMNVRWLKNYIFVNVQFGEKWIFGNECGGMTFLGLTGRGVGW